MIRLRLGILAVAVILPTMLPAQTLQLPANVKSVLERRQLPAESLSIAISDVTTGEPVLEWRSSIAQNPASTMKLVTTLAALDVLGPAYQWKTELFLAGELKNGHLDGDLVIKGYGDPFLVTERVWQLLRNIRRRGLSSIGGDLLLDDSWFDVEKQDPGAFDNQPLRSYNVQPNALLMNFKTVRYWFEPDTERGAVVVSIDPPLSTLRVDNRLRLLDRSCGGFQRGVAVAMNERADQVQFSGTFPSRWRRYAMDRTVLSHNAFTHALFTTMWNESGGVFSGDWQNVVMAGEAEPWMTFRSLPLNEVIARVNKHSNNVMARHLLYTLAAETLGPPGSDENGRLAVAEWLRANKLSVPSLVIDNGAGLSRDARISAEDMVTLLQFAWQKPYMPEFLASMPISGLDGTLRRRLDSVALTGAAHLKTGSLDHVTAIAGYLQARSGRRFAVTVLQNYENIHRGPGEEVQDAILRWLYEQ